LPLSGLAGNNPASCRAKNTPTPDLVGFFSLDINYPKYAPDYLKSAPALAILVNSRNYKHKPERFRMNFK
jgi:hypothetical protein